MNRIIAKVGRGGQPIAVNHGSNRIAGSTATTVAKSLGVSTRFGGKGGNASGLSGSGRSGGGRGR